MNHVTSPQVYLMTLWGDPDPHVGNQPVGGAVRSLNSSSKAEETKQQLQRLKIPSQERELPWCTAAAQSEFIQQWDSHQRPDTHWPPYMDLKRSLCLSSVRVNLSWSGVKVWHLLPPLSPSSSPQRGDDLTSPGSDSLRNNNPEEKTQNEKITNSN